MNDKEFMDIAIELSSKAYYPYGATLEDSKECVNEILAKSSDIADTCINRRIDIISEVRREEAVKVLNEWRERNIK